MRASAGRRILMLLENSSYPGDVRVRKEALALVSAGFDVTVISPGKDIRLSRTTIDGVTVYRYPPPPRLSGALGYLVEYMWTMIATALLMIAAALLRGFDIIHAHNPPDTFALLAAPYKLLGGKRFVFDHHDLSPEMYAAKFGSDSRRSVEGVLLILERITFRLADWVIATNDSYKAIAVERGGVPPDRVTVVRNAPDLNRVKPVQPDERLRSRATTVIGYVGEMGSQDGVDYLVRAMNHLVHDLGRVDALAVIVGHGDELEDLEDLANRLDLYDHVWFTGRISDRDLMRYLSTADICVDPDPSNPFNDRSSMIKMTEYMALGKPIVAFDLPEHRVTAEDAAIYAEPNDEADFARCIAELMDDPQRRETMGRRGRERLEQDLSWGLQERKLIEAYEGLASPSPSRDE